MIRFTDTFLEVEITKTGKFIKIKLDSLLIEYIVGTLVSIDCETVRNPEGITIATYARDVEIGDIMAVKFKDGVLHRLKEKEEDV